MVGEPDATMQPAPQDNQLMSKHRVLSFKPYLRLERRGQDGQNETEQPDHSASLGDSIASSTRIRFSVHTEARIRRLVDSNIIGIVIWDVHGRIIEANQAFLDIVGYAREDLASLRWTELTPAEWRDVDDQAFSELNAVGTVKPREKEYFRKDGSRVPVLVARALFEWNRDEGVAFVLDLTERKHVEGALRDAQANLAHVVRVTTLGELAASIAHEVNQPLAAVVANGEATLRWLGRATPDVNAACRWLEWIIDDGNRASEVIRRVRALANKTSLEKVPLDVNDVVRE